MLDKLEWLVAHNNELSGSDPTLSLETWIAWRYCGSAATSCRAASRRTWADLSTLTQLHLRTNELTGAIPAGLKDLTNLRRLWVHQNQLSGVDPA